MGISLGDIWDTITSPFGGHGNSQPTHPSDNPGLAQGWNGNTSGPGIDNGSSAPHTPNPFQGPKDTSMPVQVDPGPRPSIPEYHSLTNPDGTMQSQLQIHPGADITADQRGMDAYRKEALRDPTQASPWATMQLQRQAGSQNQAMDQAVQQQGSTNATNQANLAMHGGLSSGAAERMGTAGNRDMLNAQQNVARQGSDQRLNIGIQDEQNRVGELQNLPGMEIANTEPAFRNEAMNLNAQQANASNAIGQNNAANINALGTYGEQMRGWAAANQSNAIADATHK